MYHAVAIGNPEALLTVLESPDKPADLNISLSYPPESGTSFISPLSLAALTGSTGCLEMLLNAGADVDWQDDQTGTVVMYIA